MQNNARCKMELFPCSSKVSKAECNGHRGDQDILDCNPNTCTNSLSVEYICIQVALFLGCVILVAEQA